jgi:hypothetical protein
MMNKEIFFIILGERVAFLMRFPNRELSRERCFHIGLDPVAITKRWEHRYTVGGGVPLNRVSHGRSFTSDFAIRKDPSASLLTQKPGLEFAEIFDLSALLEP